MFTGIIQTTAKIAKRKVSGKSGKLVLLLARPLLSPERGESIAANGACLTLENFSSDGGILEFHVLAETFRRTNLGLLPLGAEVNIERAMTLNARLGGHFVTGHVDAASEIRAWKKIGGDWAMSVGCPKNLRSYFVEKGSVSVDGVSLTLVTVANDCFTVHLIPETCRATALRKRKVGNMVNIEADLIAKYVQKKIPEHSNAADKSGLNMDFLKTAGWELNRN